VARDEFRDRLGHGRWVRGDREVIATLEDDLLALREQLVEEGSRCGVDRVLRGGTPREHWAVDAGRMLGPEAPLDLLKAAVTIYLEEGKIEAARDAVTEFEEITRELTAPAIEAETSAVRGALALSEGDPGSALPLLRRAAGTWQEQDAPHEVAKLNVLIGQACRALADHDGARLEFSAARETFERLGARPDLAQLDRIVAAADAGSEIQGLTRREIEVLCLIARGKANRAIANELHLSERTVHRHVSNIFTKLDVDSRTAAVAYGIKHRIVEVGTL
jgi:DNA-binding CsgD family transcriptional regulator